MRKLLEKEVLQVQEANTLEKLVEAAQKEVQELHIAVELAKARVAALRLKQHAAANSLFGRLGRVKK